MRSMQPHDKRRRQLAQIHIAAKQLGLDDDTYRAMLREVAGVTSAADLSDTGRRKVLTHLQRLGWAPRRKGRSTPAPDKAALVAKIRAQLAAAARPDAYADGMAKRMFGIDRFEWCTPEQLRKIVAALAYDAQRRKSGMP